MEFSGYKVNQRRLKHKIISWISVSSMLLFGVLMMFFTPQIMHVAKTFTDVEMFRVLTHCIITIITRYSQLAFLFLCSYCLMNNYVRFRLLNLALRDANAHLHNTTSSELIRTLSRLAVQHYNLTVGVENINKCYSFQVSYAWIHPVCICSNQSILWTFCFCNLHRSWCIWLAIFNHVSSTYSQCIDHSIGMISILYIIGVHHRCG